MGAKAAHPRAALARAKARVVKLGNPLRANEAETSTPPGI